MTNQLIRIWVHVFFSTKDIMPLIRDSFEQELYNRIRMKLISEFDCTVRNIDGAENHVHILFKLNPWFCLSDILKNIKGESSHWVNGKKFIEAKFSWQKSFQGHSVSEEDVDKIDKFISNQKEYHRHVTFHEELDLLYRKFKLDIPHQTV